MDDFSLERNRAKKYGKLPKRFRVSKEQRVGYQGKLGRTVMLLSF